MSTPAIEADLDATPDPPAPLCPICHEPTTPYPLNLSLLPELEYDEPAWLCTNMTAHGYRPGNAAMWLQCELDHGPMTEAEARALELVIPWPRGGAA